jgi:hypothetical protein
MAYPTKPYADYSGTGFTFKTRDPKDELEYTAKLLKDVVAPSGDWATAELNVGTTLKTRYNDVVSSLAETARNEYQTLLGLIKTDVYGGNPTTPNVAYDQYLAGMSAAMGGGHASVAGFGVLATQDKQLMVHESAAKLAATLMGMTYQATSGMPLVVPIESQLVADACASAVEAHSAGNIRSQQIRQSQAAGSVLSNITPNIGTNPTPIDETVMFGSLHAQGAAASAT